MLPITLSMGGTLFYHCFTVSDLQKMSNDFNHSLIVSVRCLNIYNPRH